MQLDFLSVDEQLQQLHTSAQSVDSHTLSLFTSRFDACWIYHDLSVEGAIFRDNELERALAGREGRTWRENQLLVKIRHMRRAIAFIREAAADGVELELDFVKEIHRRLQNNDDETAGRYRKDGGPSSAYRHDIVPPKSISYRLRRLVAFVNESDPNTFGHPIGMAAHIHRELIEIFPFSCDNGLVARLAMNFWILRHGYAPAVIPIHDRQRYFECYLSENSGFRRLLVDAIFTSGEAWTSGLQAHRPASYCAA